MGNFCDKSTETTLHEIWMQVFLRFSDSSKPSQTESLIYELAWLPGIRKSEENLLKTSCKVAPVIKDAHIFWRRHDNRKQSASARERWCDVSCDIPYCIHWNLKSLKAYEDLQYISYITNTHRDFLVYSIKVSHGTFFILPNTPRLRTSLLPMFKNGKT